MVTHVWIKVTTVSSSSNFHFLIPIIVFTVRLLKEEVFSSFLWSYLTVLIEKVLRFLINFRIPLGLL